MSDPIETKDPDAIDDIDNPEWTEADFARARPFKEVHPEAYASWKRERGRPIINGVPKKQRTFRLPADLIDAIKGSGKDYGARVEKALRDAFTKGEPSA